MSGSARANTERLVDVVTRLRTSFCQLLRNRLQAFNLETDVVNATVVFAAFDTRNDVILKIEDGQVDVPVAEEVAFRTRTVELGNFLHAKHLDIKLGSGVDILGREGNVLDLGHDTSPAPDGSCQSLRGKLLPTYHVSLPAATAADDASLTAPNSTTRSRTPWEGRVVRLGVGVLAASPRPQVALNSAEHAPPRYHPLPIPVPALRGAEGQHPCDGQHPLRMSSSITPALGACVNREACPQANG